MAIRGGRADLLALSDDGLIQLANAGLVKRALREVAAGHGPALSEGEDGTVEARFADGALTRLPPGRAPGEATCTCPASGLCRHRVALVIAYRAEAPAADATGGGAGEGSWDPGTLDGPAFEAALPGTAAAELRRLLAAGISVEVDRGRDRGSVPSARLPTASVRFLVPGETAYARCDCAAGGGCAHVALAIRAFREAGGAAGGAVQVRLGGGPTAATVAEASPAGRAGGLAEAVARVVEGLVEHGTIAGPAAHGAALERLRRLAEARGATQVLLALADLEDQIAAYAERAARYDERAVLALVTELVARARVGDAAALGLGQPYETAMGKTRLVSLGARLVSRGRSALATVALADTDTGVTLGLERTYVPAEGAEEGFVAGLPGRGLSPGLSLTGVGHGQIVTSVAKRRADGLLTLGRGARGRTALLPRDAASRLPAPLAASDVGTVARRLAGRPPAALRPRDRLAAMHVFTVAEVVGQAWSPGAQVWRAAVALPGDGGRLHLARTYDRAAPAALDALAGALDGRWGPVRGVAGIARIAGGALVLDPWSIVADAFVVPDLAGGDGETGPPPPTALAPERTPLEEAEGSLAGALHAGRRAFAASAGGEGVLARLTATGHPATAERFAGFLEAGENRAVALGHAALWIAAMLEDSGPSDPTPP